jgi:hypothetical protein
MILRTRDPRERELRKQLINYVGEQDQRVLVRWIWENHRASGLDYVDALSAIVQQTGEHGPSFVHNLLDFAKKSQEVREIEQQLLAWASPKLRAAATVVLGHRGDPYVAQEEFRQLGEQLEGFLRGLFPSAHRAAVRGAILMTLKHEGGGFTLDVASLVNTMHMEDPLASNAKASWMG